MAMFPRVGPRLTRKPPHKQVILFVIQWLCHGLHTFHGMEDHGKVCFWEFFESGKTANHGRIGMNLQFTAIKCIIWESQDS